jgi:hypothetical protein
MQAGACRKVIFMMASGKMALGPPNHSSTLTQMHHNLDDADTPAAIAAGP